MCNISYPNLNTQYGWVCPRCNRVYAPGVAMCFHCQPQRMITAPTTQPYTPEIPLKDGEPTLPLRTIGDSAEWRYCPEISTATWSVPPDMKVTVLYGSSTNVKA